jgi:hypothetical protein
MAENSLMLSSRHRELQFAPTSATGTAWERTPWHATQRAAWEALNRQRVE